MIKHVWSFVFIKFFTKTHIWYLWANDNDYHLYMYMLSKDSSYGGNNLCIKPRNAPINNHCITARSTIAWEFHCYLFLSWR
jgi:hypothetical protein